MKDAFIDRVSIRIKAGDGGNGAVSFIHYKGVVNGGPDGGDGGKGGDVIFRADRHVATLAEFYYKNIYNAENGCNGGQKNCFGKAGQDLILTVPCGTIIRDATSNEIIADMFYDGDEVVVLKGGLGGKGNARFVNSLRHAPHFSQVGEKCTQQKVTLELKTIADIGLVGFPNVGKSTLLSVTTKAKPKIANYHFTTLSPNLGVAEYHDKTFVIADIPGLIEGASEGAGLGIDFLRHIERTRIIVHVVDMSGVEGRNPYKDYCKINNELKTYSEKLALLPQIVVANKMDIAGAEENLKDFKKKVKCNVIPLSAVCHQNLDELLTEMVKMLEELPEVEPEVFEPFTYAKPDKLTYEIIKNDNATFEITGTLTEVLCRNVVLDDPSSFGYLQKVLRDRGIFKELKKMGAKDGTVVYLGGIEFEYLD